MRPTNIDDPIERAKRAGKVPPNLTPCRTADDLGETTGMLISQTNLDARTPGLDGITLGHVPGHGGDVWWVQHPDGTVGAYVSTEVTDRAPVGSPHMLTDAAGTVLADLES